MKLTPLGIEGAWLAESPVWSDDRGDFCEWFQSESVLEATGIDFKVKQSNLSMSKAGTIRGIHFSRAAEGQAKWVTCVTGEILDVIVDVRPNSPTFGEHTAVKLRGGEGCSVLISSGLGHGFVAMEENTFVSYLLDSPYSPENEFGINPLDSDLEINWNYPHNKFVLSVKDLNSISFTEYAAGFKD
jgi:dTDP-4-dehydrorhamnose 3,5-epimerase